MRIAVLSPFVDRRHGTERALAELLQRLGRVDGFEIHLYSHEVDVPGLCHSPAESRTSTACVVFHRVPRFPKPHLLQFLFWLAANKLCRLRDSWFRHLRYDAVFSPGINALDADAILVHAVFHRLRELQGARSFGGLRDLHRSLYYGLMCFLERRVYRHGKLRLAAVSRHTSKQLQEYFDCKNVTVISNGVDTSQFSPAARIALRAQARAKLSYSTADRVLLLVGNDLRNKGLFVLLEALVVFPDLPWRLCVVGSDASPGFSSTLQKPPFSGRVFFAGETSDILFYYAAADLYVAPSLEDSFNLPALEAMACGVPVLVSTSAGISEHITDGVNGLLLCNPGDVGELSGALRRLFDDPGLASTLAANALSTADALSWDSHAKAICRWLTENYSAPRTSE